MSTPAALETQGQLPVRRRLATHVAVAVARVLTALPPRRIRAALRLARLGAVPATVTQAQAARDAVVAVSTRCAGQGCLQRSLATALLCRLGGTWPTWCTGVRTAPFRAHAWVEADGAPVGENTPPGYYTPTLTVPPRTR
ncbi:lasso peptide biosynthesis B2 protein [Streptomyces sp. NPDC048275]|uniref:lasso peptide biosynthesis B2 protein n=1 Tax=Streptomyces sp. NPDC048275 TaxID=3155629 RepID=UPI0033FC4854